MAVTGEAMKWSRLTSWIPGAVERQIQRLLAPKKQPSPNKGPVYARVGKIRISEKYLLELMGFNDAVIKRVEQSDVFGDINIYIESPEMPKVYPGEMIKDIYLSCCTEYHEECGHTTVRRLLMRDGITLPHYKGVPIIETQYLVPDGPQSGCGNTPKEL